MTLAPRYGRPSAGARMGVSPWPSRVGARMPSVPDADADADAGAPGASGPAASVLDASEPAAPPVTTIYAPAVPVHLGMTLGPLRRGHGDPTFHVEPGGVMWRTMRTPHGPATLRLASVGATVHATAWGSGAEWAIAGVPELLGAGDDWSDLDLARLPQLAEVLRRSPGLRLCRTGLVFEALLVAVLEQKVTNLEARRAYRWLVQRYGEPAPGPGPAHLRVIPDAAVWRRIPSWHWHQSGVTPNRSSTAVRVAAVAASVERTLAHGRGGAVVEAALTSIVGVGVWTAAETMQRAHGDPDSLSVGDYHLAGSVGWALIGEKVDDARMLELLEPWRGHRHRIARLVGISGLGTPRRGARMTIQDHRNH